MPIHQDARDLLAHGVPLALLFDLAGLGPTSEELYRTEVCAGLCACTLGSEAS